MNKFEIVSSYKDKGINIPVRKTSLSAGYDIESAENVIIPPHTVRVISTGLKVCIDSDKYLDLRVRSSIGVKNLLVMPTGASVIDADYYNNADNEGHIKVPLFNLNDFPVNILKGTRIAQGIFTTYYKAEDDSASAERTGGFGSTL